MRVRAVVRKEISIILEPDHGDWLQSVQCPGKVTHQSDACCPCRTRRTECLSPTALLTAAVCIRCISLFLLAPLFLLHDSIPASYYTTFIFLALILTFVYSVKNINIDIRSFILKNINLPSGCYCNRYLLP